MTVVRPTQTAEMPQNFGKYNSTIVEGTASVICTNHFQSQNPSNIWISEPQEKYVSIIQTHYSHYIMILTQRTSRSISPDSYVELNSTYLTWTFLACKHQLIYFGGSGRISALTMEVAEYSKSETP